MTSKPQFRIALVVAGVIAANAVGQRAQLETRIAVMAPPKPAAMAVSADVVIIGKVLEIEKDTVEATPFKGSPKEQAVAYKIAVVKIEDSLMGGKGLTQFRVGFPADAGPGLPPPGLPGGPPGVGRLTRPGRPGPGTVALTADMDGCFFLTQHHSGDFYTVVGFGSPLLKKDENYAKELENVKKVVKTFDDPVSALKVKDLGERFAAAQVLLQRYQTQRVGATAREAIPAEENKLFIALLAELPWQPDTTKPVGPLDPPAPSRSALWYSINPNEQGFKAPQPQPQRPGEPPVDYNKVMDEATLKFLKDNGAKIQIRRFAAK
ncbi:MAG TPA: hypothetical protein VHR66_31370 [Gemmataceae bacterium]|jgi:hypothetical protein|nr:hypothetical protein [Gemmataceae bacterium]